MTTTTTRTTVILAREQHPQQNSKIYQTLCSLAKSSHFRPISNDDAIGARSGETADVVVVVVAATVALDTKHLECEITIDRLVRSNM